MNSIWQQRNKSRRGEEGNILLICLLLLAMLSAIAISQFSMVQRNIQQSRFYHFRGELREYAESGFAMAIHDINNHITINEGMIGTENWTSMDDVGADGYPSTYDEGEMDGIPTLGEPNIIPESTGPMYLGAQLIVYAEDTGTPGLKRVISTAGNADDRVTIEGLIRRSVASIPRAAPVYVPPDVNLTLAGSSFVIDGNDTNLDDTPGGEKPIYGIATDVGAVPGDNQAGLISQIDPKLNGQILGQDGPPSVGEAEEIDAEAIFNYLKESRTQELPPGLYDTNDSVDLGNSLLKHYQNTYVNGDMELAGKVSGAGFLVVEGNLAMSGQCRFEGVILVRGKITISGGGQGIHVYGSIFSLGTSVEISGNADLMFSSQAMDGANSFLDTLVADFALVYYRER